MLQCLPEAEVGASCTKHALREPCLSLWLYALLHQKTLAKDPEIILTHILLLASNLRMYTCNFVVPSIEILCNRKRAC